MIYIIGAGRGRFLGPLQALYNYSWGPNSICFTLVPQHDTNMEDNMDWEAEWTELANKAWVPEAQLAESTRKAVQDFRRRWGWYTPSLPLYRSRSSDVH